MYANEEHVESKSIGEKGETDYVQNEMQQLFAPELRPTLDGDLDCASAEDTVALHSDTSH